jgi:hypothetical protein
LYLLLPPLSASLSFRLLCSIGAQNNQGKTVDNIITPSRSFTLFRVWTQNISHFVRSLVLLP